MINVLYYLSFFLLGMFIYDLTSIIRNRINNVELGKNKILIANITLSVSIGLMSLFVILKIGILNGILFGLSELFIFFGLIRFIFYVMHLFNRDKFLTGKKNLPFAIFSFVLGLTLIYFYYAI